MSVLNNNRSTNQCQSQLEIIQSFTFVRGWTAFLIEILKIKEFSLNRNEIHSTLLYKRIYEIEKFRGVIEYFTETLSSKRQQRNLRLLRKIWVINENPLPLVQEEIFDQLYKGNHFQTRYKIINDEKNNLCLEFTNIKLRKQQTISIHEFFQHENIKNQEFFLEQLTLEASLCYGRNEKCKDYFKQLYPWDWLISNAKNISLSIELRGAFLRLINYIYIDDKPHKLQRLVRTFKAFESSNQYIVSFYELII